VLVGSHASGDAVHDDSDFMFFHRLCLTQRPQRTPRIFGLGSTQQPPRAPRFVGGCVVLKGAKGALF
jgi:hypothetical protein